MRTAARTTGAGELARLALRRDRIRIPVWLAALTGLTYISGAAVGDVYPDQAAVDGYARLVEGSPVTVAFSGPPVGLQTQAGVVVYEVSFTALVGVTLMAVLMMSRHTRAEEESGRSELLRGGVVGRHAAGVAALLTTGGVCVLLGALLAAVLLPTALTAAESLIFGASVAAVGVVFAALTSCLAQVFLHSRTVTGAALTVFGVTYALRAAGDVRENWLVWLSPMGWAQAVHVPTEDRWWPLLLPLLAAGALAVTARWLAELRDFGSGLVTERRGPARARRSLAGPVGLGWRVRRGAVAGWAAGLLGLGALSGALGTSVEDALEDNPTLVDYLEATSGTSLLDAYLATMAMILALVSGGFAVWAARHRGVLEENGQAELVLAGPVGRARVMLGDAIAAVGAVVLVVVAASAGLGVTHGLIQRSVDEGWRASSAPMGYLPAVLVLVGVVLLIDGWWPRLSALAWLVLAYCAVLGWLGGLLDPPAWMLDLSPFEHTPRVPEDAWQAGAPTVLLLLVVGMTAGGLVGLRRRDVG